MRVRAVIFDWGGTLTPWHSVDHEELWLSVCARHYPAAEAAAAAAAARAAEMELWRLAENAQQSATLDAVFERAGVTASAGFLASYYEAWEPHTLTDPEAPPLRQPPQRPGSAVRTPTATVPRGRPSATASAFRPSRR